MREFRNDRLKRAQATILALLVFAQPFFALLPAAGAAPLQTRQELLNEIARRQAALSVEPEPVRRLMHGMLMAEHEYRALLARYEQELADIRKEATEDEPLVKEAQDLAKRYADLTQAAQAAGLLVPHNVAVAIRNDEYTTPSKIKVLGVPLEAMTFDAAKVGQVKTFVERQNVILDRWEEVAELYTKKYGQAAIDEFNRRLEKQRERIEELRKIHEHNKAALEKLFYGRTYEASLGEAYKADDSGRETAVKPPPLPGMRVDLELVVPKYVGDIVLRPQPAAGLNFVRDGSMYLDMAIDIENKHLDADLWLYILESNHVLLKVYDIGRGLLSAVGDPFVKNFSDDSQGFFEKIFNSIWDLGKLLTVDTVTGLVDSCRRIFATPAAFLIIPEDFNPQTDVAEEYGLTTEEAMQLIERRNAWKRAQEDLFKNLTEHTVSSVVIAQRPQGDKFAPDLEGRLKYLQALMLYRDDITARLKRLGDFNKAVDGSLEYMVDVAMPFLVYAGTKSQVAGLSKEAAAIQKAGFKNYLTENIASYKEVWKNRLESVANAGEYLNKKLKAENLVKEADAKITDGSRGNGTPQDAIVEKARQQQVEASKQLLDAHKQMADDFKAKNPDAALPQPPSAPAAPVAPAQAVKVVGQDMAVNLLDDAGKVAGKKLGSGKFGDVYELDNPVNGKAAVKTFSEKCGGIEKGNQVAMQEFSLYQKVSGELDSIITPTEALKLPSGEIVLAKELIPQQNLMTNIRDNFSSLSAKEQALVQQSILKTADTLAQQKWFYCDMHAGNLHLDLAQIKKLAADTSKSMSQLLDEVKPARLVETDNMIKVTNSEISAADIARRQVVQMAKPSSNLLHFGSFDQMAFLSDNPLGGKVGSIAGMGDFFKSPEALKMLQDWGKKYGFDASLDAFSLITDDKIARVYERLREAAPKATDNAVANQLRNAGQEFQNGLDQAKNSAKAALDDFWQKNFGDEGSSIQEVSAIHSQSQGQAYSLSRDPLFADSASVKSVVSQEGAVISKSASGKIAPALDDAFFDAMDFSPPPVAASVAGVQAKSLSVFIRELGSGQTVPQAGGSSFVKFKKSGGSTAALSDYRSLGTFGDMPLPDGSRYVFLDRGVKAVYKPTGTGAVVEIWQGTVDVQNLTHLIEY